MNVSLNSIPNRACRDSIFILIIAMITPLTRMPAQENSDLFAVVLGVAQDGGYPQTGCKKKCCELAWRDHQERKFVSSIAVVDWKSKQRFLFDCSPDFREQLKLLDQIAPVEGQGIGIDGIFLTHAHMGHYAGLMHLGREALGTQQVPVYGSPRMLEFLKKNGPWSQLIELNNIEPRQFNLDEPIRLNDRLSVKAFKVPHRDEFSDTVGFKISTESKSMVYLPDIDKWSKWNRAIENVVESTDIALLDGTFFDNGELPNRDMSQIPHPFVVESIKRFSVLERGVRSRIKFIHFNHTNPAIQFSGDPKLNAAARRIEAAGMGLARQGARIALQ